MTARLSRRSLRSRGPAARLMGILCWRASVRRSGNLKPHSGKGKVLKRIVRKGSLRFENRHHRSPALARSQHWHSLHWTIQWLWQGVARVLERFERPADARSSAGQHRTNRRRLRLPFASTKCARIETAAECICSVVHDRRRDDAVHAAGPADVLQHLIPLALRHG